MIGVKNIGTGLVINKKCILGNCSYYLAISLFCILLLLGKLRSGNNSECVSKPTNYSCTSNGLLIGDAQLEP